MIKKIKELFAPPIGLKLVDVVDGIKLYSSAKLMQNFLLAFKKSSRGSDKVKLIETLMNKGLIIPCFKSKGVLRFLKHKFFGSQESKAILGMYHLVNKKVYILIDNNSTIFGTSSNDELVSTTLHEAMHLAAGRNMKGFLKVMMPTLRKYYGEAFTHIFSLKNTPNIDKIIYHLSLYETPKKIDANKQLSIYYHLLYDTFKDSTELEEKQFRLKLQNYIVSMKIFFVSFSTFVRSYKKWQSIFIELNHAYEKTFGKRNRYTSPFQELVSVSEVACVMAEMKSNDKRVNSILKILR